MHAARAFDPAGVRPRGGYYLNRLWHERQGHIEVRRPSCNQFYGEIPAAGAEGGGQAVRAAQNALKQSTKFFFASRGQHETQHQ